MTDVVNGVGGQRSIAVLEELAPEQARDVLALVSEAAAVDGQPAVSEQGRLQLKGRRAGVRHVLVRNAEGELVGYAQLEDSDPVEAPAGELVVHPGHRGRGHGRALGSALLAESGKRLRVWAHGGHPAARHLAQVLGLSLFRELRQMRRPLAGLDLSEPALPEGVTVRAFRPGEDDAAWLALNAAAFAHHPEQGSLTQRDLDDRKAAEWFDPEGFFLAEKDGGIVGFHWTKVHAAEGLGEVYVLGVRPGFQGGGLGKALTTLGLRHLAAQGLPTAMLYVDADNLPAVAVYERLGFAVHETDLMYRTES
ncbi:mycothiol synthase [Streptomyces albireticuli]|uniref:Mycothiol acetyltransferase n=1 Tax=Streptomyces albireticuli TaxID=1940 RepID=A0A2A2D9R1_9ACTN|nr:mycothiol synthase [Streptomyces albireticuli]MCD9143051.1 mycothiol synthase [Streptomyces albireticuli]MCD9165294.1 mycothiol synthase [Streptomyces albireticuli]MCD9192188.1 mycothiol synthase [Streptomyces albireticuli]PAU48176.1 mycothiol synthase [Streptomyces albireticuli]